jgi:integrase/recombinase XerD
MGMFYKRMLTTLKIHGMSESTINNYLAEMNKFIKFFMVPPDKLTKENIYQYQAYLVNDKKVGYSSFRIMVNALRFFYNKVLGWDWIIKYIPYQKKSPNCLLF